MNTITETLVANRGAGVPIPTHTAHVIPVLACGMVMSLFLVVSYLLCVLGYLDCPSLSIGNSALAIFLLGFILLSWSSFFLGLIESLAGAGKVLAFGPPFNFLAARL